MQPKNMIVLGLLLGWKGGHMWAKCIADDFGEVEEVLIACVL